MELIVKDREIPAYGYPRLASLKGKGLNTRIGSNKTRYWNVRRLLSGISLTTKVQKSTGTLSALWELHDSLPCGGGG